MKTLSIETRTHGRVLVREHEAARILVVGFHGYSENAEIQMTRLEAIPEAERWMLVSVQGLHRFYRGKSSDISAGWMTRQDRDDMIADNIEYADRVLDAVARPGVKIVTIGFSQGVAMAFRSGVRGRRRADAVIAVGGDVPPELFADPSVAFPPVLLARGETDDWYTTSKLDSDVAALAARGIQAQVSVYPGGHEWTARVGQLAGDFILAAFGKD